MVFVICSWACHLSLGTLEYQQLPPFPGTKGLLIPSNRDKIHHKPGCGVKREAEERTALISCPFERNRIEQSLRVYLPLTGQTNLHASILRSILIMITEIELYLFLLRIKM